MAKDEGDTLESIQKESFGVKINITGALVAIIVAALVGAITVLMLPIYALQGWVITKLWAWFVPTTLIAWAPSLWQAVGLVILIGVIRYKAPGVKEEDEKKKWRNIGVMFLYQILGPLGSLGLGAIIKFWIMKG